MKMTIWVKKEVEIPNDKLIFLYNELIEKWETEDNYYFHTIDFLEEAIAKEFIESKGLAIYDLKSSEDYKDNEDFDFKISLLEIEHYLKTGEWEE